MHTVRMSVWRRPIVTAGVAFAVLAAAGCSGGGSNGGSDATAVTTGLAVAADPDTAASSTAAGADRDDDTAASGDSATATDAATTTIGTVPDEGVPGIDSVDAFCRSWSEFAGSFQALAVATSFGSDPAAVSRLEVAAAPLLIGAGQGLADNLPPEVESERTTLSDLVGPMLRRADRARVELVAAGLGDEAIAALGEAWRSALSDAGLDEPDIPLVVPDGVDAAGFDAASAAFAAALPPINQDPSLITNASVPLIEQYLRENCPDQGTLGGNDIIDEF